MDDPDFTIGGQKLGTQYVEVLIDKVIVSDEPLIRPFGMYEVMHQVDEKFIAWPKSLVSLKLCSKLFFLSPFWCNFYAIFFSYLVN